MTTALSDKPTVVRTDGWDNFLTGVNTSRDKREWACIEPPQVFDQSDLEHFYRGNDLAKRICNLPAFEMTRKGWELDVDEDGEDVAEIKKGVHEYHRKLGIPSAVFRGLAFARLYGRSYLLLGIDDGLKADKPVNWDKVRALRYVNLLDPYAMRVDEIERDPFSPDFGKPKFYRLNTTGQAGARVHSSRVIALDGSIMTPLMERQGTGAATSTAGVAYVPDSVFVPLYKVLRDYDSTWDNAAILIQDFSQAVIKMRGLAEMMASHGEKAVRERMEIIDTSRSVLRAVLLDAELEDFKREPTPMTGLPDLMDRWLHRVAAAAEMPITLLFGMAPGGLNATGESDLENFYNAIEAKQESDLRPVLDVLVRAVLCAKDGPTEGQEPETWKVCFNKLWQLDEVETAALRKTVAETDQIYLQNQVVSPNEVAVSRFGGEEYSTETTIDIDAHDDKAAMADEVAKAEAAALVAAHGATARANTEQPPPETPEATPVSAGGEPHERAKTTPQPTGPAGGATPGVAAPTDARSPASGVAPLAAGPAMPTVAAGDQPVEKTAFNGTQMGQVLAYAVAVGEKTVSREFAVEALSLLLQLTPEQADKLLANMGRGFEPKPPDPPVIAGMPGKPGAKPGAPGAKPPAGKPSGGAPKLDADVDHETSE